MAVAGDGDLKRWETLFKITIHTAGVLTLAPWATLDINNINPTDMNKKIGPLEILTEQIPSTPTTYINRT